MKQFSTHNLDKLLVPDTTILNKTVDRWRTFHPTITCAIKDCRIQMTTMAARERLRTLMQRTTDYWQIVSTPHDPYLKATTTVQTSDLKFRGRLVTPNYPSTAHRDSTKLDLGNRLACTQRPQAQNQHLGNRLACTQRPQAQNQQQG